MSIILHVWVWSYRCSLWYGEHLPFNWKLRVYSQVSPCLCTLVYKCTKNQCSVCAFVKGTIKSRIGYFSLSAKSSQKLTFLPRWDLKSLRETPNWRRLKWSNSITSILLDIPLNLFFDYARVCIGRIDQVLKCDNF